MCELLGMSANTPTDICFSITGLMERGGRTGPHKDGWGVVFYDGKGVREFRDPQPGVSSHLAEIVKTYPIKSHIVLSHIRQANSGRVCLENTHPFKRELWGKNWSFAHNGQLKGMKQPYTGGFKPVGTTDSEAAFCWLLNQIHTIFGNTPPKARQLWAELPALIKSIQAKGVFNFLLSDSDYLYAYCSNNLSWLTRSAPFSTASLVDTEMSVDFNAETTPDDIVTVIATQPLTDSEPWTRCQPGELLVFKHGKIVKRANVLS